MANKCVNIGILGGGGGNLTALIENRWIQWIFVLSCFSTSAAFNKPSIVSLLGNALAFVLAYYLTFHKKILRNIFQPYSRSVFFLALVFAFIAVGFNVPQLLNYFPNFPYRVQTRLGIPQVLQMPITYTGIYCLYLTTAPAFFTFFYAFIIRLRDFATELYKTSDKIERRIFVIIMVIAFVALTIIYNQTNCFYQNEKSLCRKNAC